MAETLTIARPYAQAAFLFASEHHTLKDWSEMLELLAAVASDPTMAQVIDNPQLTETQVADLFIGIGGERIDENCQNFIRLLAENRRLHLLPDIAAQFEIQRREAEHTVKAELITAYPASESQKDAVIAALEANGVAIEDIQTTNYAIYPHMTVRKNIGNRHDRTHEELVKLGPRAVLQSGRTGGGVVQVDRTGVDVAGDGSQQRDDSRCHRRAGGEQRQLQDRAAG